MIQVAHVFSCESCKMFKNTWGSCFWTLCLYIFSDVYAFWNFDDEKQPIISKAVIVASSERSKNIFKNFREKPAKDLSWNMKIDASSQPVVLQNMFYEIVISFKAFQNNCSLELFSVSDWLCKAIIHFSQNWFSENLLTLSCRSS